MLGRRLGVSEPELDGIDHEHNHQAEKAYQMLIKWRKKKGSAATYQPLCDGLEHELVQRRDLAEKFLNDGNYFLQYICNVGTLV